VTTIVATINPLPDVCYTCDDLQQALIDSLRKEEVSLQEKVDSLHHRKASIAAGLVVLHQQLRNVEHKLCLKVWDVVHEGK
jgi:hypothetical protein